MDTIANDLLHFSELEPMPGKIGGKAIGESDRGTSLPGLSGQS